MNRTEDKDDKRKPPRLNLPFQKRREEPGAWAYDHRAGLCITVIVYLVMAIAFVSSRIVIDRKPASHSFIVDFRDIEELERQKQELEREIMRKQAASQTDYSQVENQRSNENAERTARTNASSAMTEGGARTQSQMDANRRAYEQGLREEQQMIEAARNRADDPGSEPASDARIEGNVTVSYSLDKPLRTAVLLDVPAYLCEGGGEVVVKITVNRNGRVTAAEVDRSRTNGDSCMTEAALASARKSRFNLDTSAPERHQGTITYLFVPQ